MAEHIIFSAPFFVAAFWSLWLGLDYRTHPSAPRLSLLCFMITTAVLYLCHFIYFSLSGHAPWPVDLLYRYCNLAVFPLWHFYLCRLTLHRLSRREQFLWLMPAVLLALLIFCMSTLSHSTPGILKGYLSKYQKSVSPADKGAIAQ